MEEGGGGIRVVWRVMVEGVDDMAVMGRGGGVEGVVGEREEVGGVLVGRGMMGGGDGGRRLISCEGVRWMMVVGVFGGGGAMEVTPQYSDPQSISENRMIKVRLRCGRGTAGLKGLRGGVHV